MTELGISHADILSVPSKERFEAKIVSFPATSPPFPSFISHPFFRPPTIPGTRKQSISWPLIIHSAAGQKMSSSRPTTAKDLSKQQMKDMREAFRLFDKKNEGKIGVDELGEVRGDNTRY